MLPKIVAGILIGSFNVLLLFRYEDILTEVAKVMGQNKGRYCNKQCGQGVYNAELSGCFIEISIDIDFKYLLI